VASSNQTFTYAPSGMRVRLTDSATAANNRKYAYSAGGTLLSEYTDAGWKRDVIYLGSEAIAEIDAAGTHELHNDHLGTPRIVTKGNGTTAATIEGRQAYGPYGEMVQSQGYVPLAGYTGHIQTDATGLIYMRGRFYTPGWHRFVNSDQGVDPASWNQMAYASGTPFHVIDPSGKLGVWINDCVYAAWEKGGKWAEGAGGLVQSNGDEGWNFYNVCGGGNGGGGGSLSSSGGGSGGGGGAAAGSSAPAPQKPDCSQQAKTLVMLVARPVNMPGLRYFANHDAVMFIGPSGAALLQSYPDQNKAFGQMGQNRAGVLTGNDALYSSGAEPNGFNTFSNVIYSTWVDGDLVGSGYVNFIKDSWNEADISYNPLNTNSNFFAFSVFNLTTGQKAPSHSISSPGSNYALCR
jgi:RHS repeat-associated protein